MTSDTPPPSDAPPPSSDEEAEALLEAGLSRPTGSSKAPPAPPEAIAEHFPDYEILDIVGHGGMGVVYKARQRKLDRVVALKVLPPELSEDPAFAERFAREARTLARLQHPHIVGVHDFGQAGGRHYLVMEFVDGVTLRRLMAAGELTPREALAIVPQICDALQYAHEEGVVHRDIKPENVLLDRAGRVKVADFGLAKLVRRGPDDFTLTGTDQVMGTLHYMAPEQYKTPQDVDHRADIFSLGVVFYEMLTGDLPMGRFEKPSEAEGLDARIDAIVMRALEREREQRYQTAGEVRSDVDTLAGERPAVSSWQDELPRRTVADVFRGRARARGEGSEQGPRRMSRWALWALLGLPITAVVALGVYLVVDAAGDPDPGLAVGGLAAWWTALGGASATLLVALVAVIVTSVCRATVRGQATALVALVLALGGIVGSVAGLADEAGTVGLVAKMRDRRHTRRVEDMLLARIRVEGVASAGRRREIARSVSRTWERWLAQVRVRDPDRATVIGHRLYDDADARILEAMDGDEFEEKRTRNELGIGLAGARSLRRPPYDYRITRIEVDAWERTAKVTVVSQPAMLSQITFPVKRSEGGWVFALGPVQIREK